MLQSMRLQRIGCDLTEKHFLSISPCGRKRLCDGRDHVCLNHCASHRTGHIACFTTNVQNTCLLKECMNDLGILFFTLT